MRIRAAIAAVILLAPSWAGGQDVDALRMSLRKPSFAPADASGIALDSRIGRCLGSEYQTTVLSLVPRSARSNDELVNLALGGSTCGTWEERIRYSAPFLRGPIAESYLRKLQSGKKMSKAELRIYAEPTTEKLAQLPPNVRTEIALVAIGSCVDKADHARTLKVFDTRPGTPDESMALQALTAALSNCIPPGVQFGFSKFDLRGYLADGSYRNAVESISTPS